MVASFIVPPGLKFDNIVTGVQNVRDVHSLPNGVTVGDTYGGRSFSDDVALALERRSCQGWCEVEAEGLRWTVIVLQR